MNQLNLKMFKISKLRKFFCSLSGDKQKIGYIGTGKMGKQQIFKLLNDKYEVQVYDKYPEAAQSVLSEGAIWKNSPKEACEGMDLVITNLPQPENVLENMLGENGGIKGMSPKSTWMDFSTTDYHITKLIATEIRKKGVYCLESPVSNLSHMGVDFCNASFYLSGDKEGYNLSKKTLESIGEISFFVNENIGRAQTVKLLTNLNFYTATAVLAEILMIAKINQIPLLWLWDFLKSSTGICFTNEQVTPFIFDGSFDYSCSLEIGVKDMDLTVKLADELHVPIPIGKITEERYRKAGEKYSFHDNHVKVSQLVQEENNISLVVPDFNAPSPYGLNRNYVHSNERVVDKWGRKKPYPYQIQYNAPEPLKDQNKMDIAHTLTEFFTYINYLSLQEASHLGRNIELSDELISDVIRWSCGSSWVSDNIDCYKPNNNYVVNKMKSFNFNNQAILPVIKKVLNHLETI